MLNFKLQKLLVKLVELPLELPDADRISFMTRVGNLNDNFYGKLWKLQQACFEAFYPRVMRIWHEYSRSASRKMSTGFEMFVENGWKHCVQCCLSFQTYPLARKSSRFSKKFPTLQIVQLQTFLNFLSVQMYLKSLL